MSDPRDPPAPTRVAAALSLVLRLVALGLVVWGALALLDWLETATAEMKAGGTVRVAALALMLVVYALMIAVPFVPGIEVGLSLMMVEGPAIAPFVYAATLAGLGLSYAAGATISEARLARGLARLGLGRSAALVARLGGLPPMRRLALLRARLPGRWGDALVRRRYLLLAVLLNLPGNVVIGGGGGIALTAGASRLFSPGPAAAAMALAILPVPLAVWLVDRPLLPLVG